MLLESSWLPFSLSSVGLADWIVNNDRALDDLYAAPPAYRSNITIVIQMAGEMGNFSLRLLLATQ